MKIRPTLDIPVVSQAYCPGDCRFLYLDQGDPSFYCILFGAGLVPIETELYTMEPLRCDACKEAEVEE